MRGEKLEQQLIDRASDWAMKNCDTNVSALAAFARAELLKARQEILDEIISSFLGPTGGWLDSPKAVSAAIAKRFDRLAE